VFFSLGKTKTCSHADALLFGRERKRSGVFSTLLSVSFVCVLLFVVSSLSSSSFTSSQQKKEYSSADFECCEKEKKVNLLEISNELTNYETLNQFLYFYTPKERGIFIIVCANTLLFVTKLSATLIKKHSLLAEKRRQEVGRTETGVEFVLARSRDTVFLCNAFA